MGDRVLIYGKPLPNASLPYIFLDIHGNKTWRLNWRELEVVVGSISELFFVLRLAARYSFSSSFQAGQQFSDSGDHSSHSLESQ